MLSTRQSLFQVSSNPPHTLLFSAALSTIKPALYPLPYKGRGSCGANACPFRRRIIRKALRLFRGTCGSNVPPAGRSSLIEELLRQCKGTTKNRNVQYLCLFFNAKRQKAEGKPDGFFGGRAGATSRRLGVEGCFFFRKAPFHLRMSEKSRIFAAESDTDG